MRIEPAEHGQHRRAIARRLSHADDAAAAHAEPCLLYVPQRIETLLVGARGNDLRIELRRGIQIVVVRGQSRGFQSLRLTGREHAQRRADFHAQRRHLLDHLQDGVERLAVVHLTPRGTHAEARRSVIPGHLRSAKHGRRIHQSCSRDARLVVSALRTVRAVFGAASGLDAQQRATLNGGGIVMFTVNGLRAEQELGKGKVVQSGNGVGCPVVADGHRVCGSGNPEP